MPSKPWSLWILKPPFLVVRLFPSLGPIGYRSLIKDFAYKACEWQQHVQWIGKMNVCWLHSEIMESIMKDLEKVR